jgi:hypothetical protein
MFDGTTDVDMSNKGLDAGDSHIIAAALEKNDLADTLRSYQKAKVAENMFCCSNSRYFEQLLYAYGPV